MQKKYEILQNNGKIDFFVKIYIFFMKNYDFCEKLTDKISANSVRVDIDDRNESIGKRIREAEKEWIRYILVIGEKEANSENLSIRDRKTGTVREISFDEFINEIHEQTKDKPFTGLNFPKYISKRPNLMV